MKFHDGRIKKTYLFFLCQKQTHDKYLIYRGLEIRYLIKSIFVACQIKTQAKQLFCRVPKKHMVNSYFA
jgi:hypothetical protein